jgi:hypothetical protein
MNKFTATDGKEYETDVWYPLPFLVQSGKFKFAGVPTTDAGLRLVRRFSDPDNSILPWTWLPLERSAREFEAKNPATHWMVISWSDYTI